MSSIDWESTSFEDRLGCGGTILVMVPVWLAAVASQAFAAHKIWGWYPPFELPQPSFMHVAAMLTLLSLVRGHAPQRKWTNREWLQKSLTPIVTSWMVLGLFALLRLLAS